MRASGTFKVFFSDGYDRNFLSNNGSNRGAMKDKGKKRKGRLFSGRTEDTEDFFLRITNQENSAESTVITIEHRLSIQFSG